MPRPKPPYTLLRQHYPSPRQMPAAELWHSIGHPENAANPAWQNTCAIRMSLALLGAGVPIPAGFLKVRAGRFTGRVVEITVVGLAGLLCKEWGEPEKYSGALAWERIQNRKGVIRFVRLWGPFDPQGHIDLLGPAEKTRVMECAGACFFHAVEIWFWELS